ncbi:MULTISPECIES: response regulator transcription factor [unclassified Streptomyces]|uniref:LuxR C-terminal-related transcriptional regulator n=1 Tax=unclassified Streptomyces TaxID=2593676 RepID=UPI002365DFC9|nr:MULTISPECIES: response regulator transcription factor [unclassified Streptomyces]MDF3139903.1 response regulator transcription factor [Streptomyces sp. T21Q-yed]WDF43992.1 response regulator transcription factor [Streptomyces sp. T12]
MKHGTSLANTPAIAEQDTLHVSLFVEDELLRKGLQKQLSELAIVRLAHSCATLAELSRVLSQGQTDVLVVSGSQSAALRACLSGRSGPAPRVLVLLDESQLTSTTPLNTLPADGFLLREEVTEQTLDRALAQLARNEMPMPLRLGRRLVASLEEPGRGRFPLSPLTARERETLVHLTEGLSNKQIARQLGISDHGVKRLVGNILLKLGTPNRTAAAVFALEAGLLTDTPSAAAARGERR